MTGSGAFSGLRNLFTHKPLNRGVVDVAAACMAGALFRLPAVEIAGAFPAFGLYVGDMFFGCFHGDKAGFNWVGHFGVPLGVADVCL
jgi:hypothetical protein